ncbi:MAG: carbohydrate ABC transporter permease [Bauldia sp.]|nr:carbohydrate ABC transporter permease [Bauldia sp.]
MSVEAATVDHAAIVRSARRSRIIERVVVYGGLGFFALVYLFPLAVMLLTSIKPLSEIHAGNILALPAEPTLEPWRAAWSEACVGVECVGLKGFYLNTFIIVIPATVIGTLIGALNGFALTKFRFPYHRLVFGLILFGTFTPYQSVLIPMARTLGSLGLSGNLAGLIFVHTIYGLPFTTVFARGFYYTVPQELVKAAQVDGAGFFRTFWSVMLPISTPILIVSVIWMFTNIWNDFLFGSAYAFGSNAPIMVALNNIVNTSTGEKPYNVHMAAAMLAAIPTLILYVVAGKYFIRGLMSGSVKG